MIRTNPVLAERARLLIAFTPRHQCVPPHHHNTQKLLLGPSNRNVRYAGATNTEDDIQIISTRVPFAPDDDAGDNATAATPLPQLPASASGVVGFGGDVVDVYSFSAKRKARITIMLSLAAPYEGKGRSNLDAELALLDDGGNPLATWTNNDGLLAGSFTSDSLPREVRVPAGADCSEWRPCSTAGPFLRVVKNSGRPIRCNMACVCAWHPTFSLVCQTRSSHSFAAFTRAQALYYVRIRGVGQGQNASVGAWRREQRLAYRAGCALNAWHGQSMRVVHTPACVMHTTLCACFLPACGAGYSSYGSAGRYTISLAAQDPGEQGHAAQAPTLVHSHAPSNGSRWNLTPSP